MLTGASGARRARPSPRGTRAARTAASRRPAGVRTLAAGVVLAVGAVALYLGPHGGRGATGGNLVANGTFDDDLAGWTATGSVGLDRSPAAHGGSHAAVLSTSEAGRDVLLDDSPDIDAALQQGSTYDVHGWVRTDAPVLAGEVRVRQLDGEREVAAWAGSFSLTDEAWTPVMFSFSAETPGTSLDLSVLGRRLGTSQRLYVDDLSLTERPRTSSDRAEPSVPAPVPTLAPTPTPAPTPTLVPTTTPTPSRAAGPSIGTMSNGAGVSSRGIPARGALVGAAVGGNTDPAAFEKKVGRLGVRRTYWGPDEVDRSVLTARADLARGRLPWISFKLPYSWSRMADGDGDAWTRDLALKLSRLPGPVWVAFHHEPETEGNIEDWTRMQEHLGPILRRVAPNAAFTVILTGYHELRGGDPRYALDKIWPATEVDVVGFDIYNYYGTRTEEGKTVAEPSDLRRWYFEPIGRWAAAKGVAWGLAETGLNDQAADRYPRLMLDTYRAMVDNGGVVFTYFNSPYHSSSSWSITTRAKADQFASVVQAAPTFPKFV